MNSHINKLFIISYMSSARARNDIVEHHVKDLWSRRSFWVNEQKQCCRNIVNAGQCGTSSSGGISPIIINTYLRTLARLITVFRFSGNQWLQTYTGWVQGGVMDKSRHRKSNANLILHFKWHVIRVNCVNFHLHKLKKMPGKWNVQYPCQFEY